MIWQGLKKTEQKQNHPVMLRFTDTEYEIIMENAKGTGLPLAEFLRKQIMGKRVTVKYEIVADVPTISYIFEPIYSQTGLFE